ncbi:MAG: 30S ribosome-binding factor RbfA [Spirochaetes bacterium]|nr:30S ribosome-binding factor RbfA [Spirochaetota bacterium]
MKKHRKAKIQELVRREIIQIVQNELKDPRVQGLINVNRVELTADLKSAKVYISIFGIEEEEVKKAFKALKNAIHFIEHRLLKNLSLRYVPELTIIRDSSIEKGVELVTKLDKIKEEREAYVKE